MKLPSLLQPIKFSLSKFDSLDRNFIASILPKQRRKFVPFDPFYATKQFSKNTQNKRAKLIF
eukprot:UN06830